jgi:arylsulfatase A-like enzyme
MPGGARPAGLALPAVLSLAVVLACGSERVREPGGVGRDDIVVIVLDTLRADHLGAWGYRVPTSPNLDRLAEVGIRLERFFTTAAWTRPAMATLQTGLYARSVGVYEERYDVLPPDVLTVPEQLRESGYLTLGLTANPNVNAWFGFDQGFVEYVDSDVVFDWLMPVGEGQRGFHRERNPMASADEVTDRALALVDAHAEALTRAPLYLQLLYVDPHFPYAPPPAHREAVGGGGDRIALYDAEIHFVDAEIGRLLAGLEQRGLLERAFVVVTSDHGEGLFDHPSLPLGSAHGDHLYSSVLHVPLIISHPALPDGRVLRQVASTVDLAPTLLDVARIEWGPGELHGRSLLPMLRSGEPWPGDRVFSETDWRYANKVTVRTATHQYVRNDDSAAFQRDGAHEGLMLGGKETLMLSRIPPEEFLGTSNDSGLWDELVASLERWEVATPRRPPHRRDPEDVLTRGDGTVVPTPGAESPVSELDPAHRRQLEALGYLGDDSP